MEKRNIYEIIAYLKDDLFIPFSNTDEFPEISSKNREILRKYGMPTNENGSYPKVITSGELKKMNEQFIVIGNLPRF